MTKKEELLAINSYEEYQERKGEFRGLDAFDPEIHAHLEKLFPKLHMTREELYKTPPSKGGTIGR